MATISAELLPESAAVRLSIQAITGIQSLVRRDANGINDVRTLPGVLGVAPATRTARTNAIINPSYETVDTAWTGVGGTFTRVSFTAMQGQLGTRVAQLASDGTSTSPHLALYTGGQRPAVAAGQWLGFSAWTATEQGGYETRLQVTFRNAAGTGISGGTFYSAWGTAPFYAGRSHQLVAQAPADAVTAALYIHFRDGVNPTVVVAAGKRLWADQAMAVVAASQAAAQAQLDAGYFDGATLDTELASYAWTGTAHASASTETVQDVATTVTDYEAAAGPLRYDLVTVGGALVSLDVADFPLDSPWLFTPVIPGYSRKLAQVREVTGAQPSTSTVHDGLLGRADPIVIMRPPGTRRGSLKIYAGTYAQALEVLSPLRQATAMMLRQPEHQGLDMYFAATDSDIFHEEASGQETVFGVTLSYVEVKRPEGPLAGALGWTYAALLADPDIPRYADQRRVFATYADMRLNKRIQ